MVRITLTLLAMSVSALAATINNPNGLNVRSEPELAGRGVAAPAYALGRRQDEGKTPDSAQMTQLKKDRDAIAPELTTAKQAVKDAMNTIPQDVKDKIKAAKQKEHETFKALPQDKKDQLKAKESDIRKERQAEKSAASPSAAAATPAPTA